MADVSKIKLGSTTYNILDEGAIANITRSGTTFTATKRDGTTFTFTQQDNNTTYNFSGTTFYSGNKDTAEHNANNAIKNGNYYYSSNGPATSLGASTNDGALYVQSHSDSWVGQIAQDYRNGGLFVRGKNNGTWQAWAKVYDSSHKPTAADVGAAASGHTHSFTPAGTIAVQTAGSTTSITPVSSKTVVTSASGATAAYANGILTITNGSFSTGASVTAGTAVTVKTGDAAYKFTGTAGTTGAASA